MTIEAPAKLHAILVRHIAPKDRHESIETYVIANDEDAILDRLCESNSTLTYGRWADRNEDGEVWDFERDDGTFGEETYLERMKRLRGDFHDDEDDSLYEDAFYGKTHFGWDAGKPVSNVEIAVLLSLGVAQDWRVPAEVA